MQGSEFKIARRLGVRPGDVREVSAEVVLQELQGKISPAVLEVATENVPGAKFWRFGPKFFLDDPEEEEPIAFEDLRYDPELGLYDV